MSDNTFDCIYNNICNNIDNLCLDPTVLSICSNNDDYINKLVDSGVSLSNAISLTLTIHFYIRCLL